MLNPFSGGVGIGTAAPGARLDVRGDVKLGSTGEFYAVASEERHRILALRVFPPGLASGPGYSISHPSTGLYTISFTQAFANAPAVTVTPIVSSLPAGFIAECGMSTFGPVDHVDVSISNRSGTPVDCGFSFIVVGRR